MQEIAKQELIHKVEQLRSLYRDGNEAYGKLADKPLFPAGVHSPHGCPETFEQAVTQLMTEMKAYEAAAEKHKQIEKERTAAESVLALLTEKEGDAK